MEVNEQNLEALATYLRKTLSINGEERCEAEKALKQIERNENYSKLLLRLCERGDVPDSIRRASVITFKNLVKKNWPTLDATSATTNPISLNDRNYIKQQIVDLMIRSPEHIQQQLSESITVIGRHDFPDQWPSLLDRMVHHLQEASSTENSFQSIFGILATAHSLFERYRHEPKSDDLWLEIKLVLERFAPSFSQLFQSLVNYYPQKETDLNEMKNVFNALHLMIKIFYDLNAQELPEHFEDNLKLYMTHFLALLAYEPRVQNFDMTIVNQVKTEVCRSVTLFADNYTDDFKPYAAEFASAIWILLSKLNLSPSFDELVGTAMGFLSKLAARSHHSSMFQGDALKILCEQVILPNLFLRKSDIEEFEDNADEYIRKDIEKSDSATRRRAACDFLQSLCIFFEAQVVAIFSHYVEMLQNEYQQNPVQNWPKKDACIFLVLALASKGETQKFGITKTSSFISIPAFYINSIYPELKNPDTNGLPLIKAASLKFLIDTRNQLDRETLLLSLPESIRYLTSSNSVVQSYAALAIDRLLLVRHQIDQKMLVINKSDLIVHAQTMFDHSFRILVADRSFENEYVMRAVMRFSSSLHEAVLPYLSQLMDKLVLILRRISRNPTKPNFNHYLFETIAVLIRTSVAQNPSIVIQFEQVLFSAFTPIFTDDVAEFVPYALQILGFLIESHPSKSTNLSDVYRTLFSSILNPAFWDRSGNIPALSRLVQAYIEKAGETIVLEKLTTVLAIFQRLVSQSKTYDHEGFSIVQSLIIHLPHIHLTNYLKEIFIVIFTRLTKAKTQKLIRCIVVFFCYFAVKCGAQELINQIDNIQPNLFQMVIERLFLPELTKIDENEKKLCAISVTHLLCDPASMTNGLYTGTLWIPLLQSLVELFESTVELQMMSSVDKKKHVQEDLDIDFIGEIDEITDYTPAFSMLAFAKKSHSDIFSASVLDARCHLASCLQKLTVSHPNQFVEMMKTGLSKEHLSHIQKYCALANVTLV